MSTFQSLRRKRTTRSAFLVGVVAVAGMAAYLAPAEALPPIGPTPATGHAVTLTAAPVVNLVKGQAVTFTVHTAGGTTLVGNLTAHVCQHGFTTYGTTNFAYDGSNASRCVYQPNIVSGGLVGGDYEKVYGPYAGTETTSGPLTFKAGTGSVTWGNNSGFGPFSLTANNTHVVDLVIQVNLSGDATPVTYFIQPLTFATIPTAPRTVVAKPATTATTTGPLVVSFLAPLSNGGSPITSYTATCTSTNAGVAKTVVRAGAAVTPITVPGLTTGKTYKCTVKATNAVGAGPVSAPSGPVIVGSPAATAKPTVAKAAAGKIKVTFIPLSAAQANGSPLTTPNYTAICTSSNAGVTNRLTGTTSPITVAGLTAGKTYTCTVTAHNARGYGLASPASVAVVA